MNTTLKILTTIGLTAVMGAVFPVAAADIVVGQVAPFTGALASTGKGLQLGAQVYFDAVNAKGGIQGHKIRVVSEDDGYKAEETVKKVKKILAEEKPVALFGLVGTGNVEALVKDGVLATEEIPLVGPRTGATSLRKPNPLLFHIRVDYKAEAEKMVAQLIPFGLKKIAVLYQNDAFGNDGLNGVQGAMEKHGLQLIAKGSYEKNTTKVEEAVKVISKENPQAVLLISNTAATAEFVKQYRVIDKGTQLLALSVTDADTVVKTIGIETARGLGIVMVVPLPRKQGVALVNEFQKNFQEFGPKNTDPSLTVLEGYVTAKVLVEGLRRAGKNLQRSTVLKGLQSIDHFDVGGYQISFNQEKKSVYGYVEIGVIGGDGKIKM
ncbi:MAG: ABC transporter substrate-binding protein [Pseudomonadota bacterium]